MQAARAEARALRSRVNGPYGLSRTKRLLAKSEKRQHRDDDNDHADDVDDVVHEAPSRDKQLRTSRKPRAGVDVQWHDTPISA